MSRENVETVQRAVEAWNADDLDAFLAELDADVEWHPAIQPGLEGEATTYRGHDGAREIWKQDRGEAWERLRNRTRELRDLGESVLALGHMDLTARATAIEFSQELGEVFDLRAGKIVRIRDFLTHAEAIEAAGLKARIEAVLAARNRGDWDALFAQIDPDAEWQPITDTVVYRGREAIAEYFAGWDDAWAEFRIEVDRIEVSQDEDLALLAARYRGRGKGSEVDVDGNFYTVWELRQGRVLRCSEYAQESEAQAEFKRRR